jgi:uncharacterized protein (DUF488 family)
VENVIYTVGTSTRSKEEFTALCREFKLQTVVDVRRFPTSKLPHFKKDSLSSELEHRGIEYLYLGNLLGGFRDEGYGRHTRSSDFQKGLDKLKEIARQSTAAFMCAERFPWRCHRRFIASKLVQDGWRVIHILDKEKTWEPTKTPTLFDPDI